ncbi:hypothetical protein GGR56DRAFT_667091 [Xylariaceae sp. FL0804]|nr:hypothetical protein GGR56DRAFT_667091 [Xylariaceae sp. FL0804]
MVLSALTLGPDAVLALLRATFDPVWCPNYIIEDIINYHFLRNKPYNTNGGKDRDFARLALYMLEAYPPGRIVLVPAVLTRVAGALSTRQLVEYHELLKAIQHPLTPDTLLRFADIFARWPDGKVRAAEIICTLTERPGFDINSLSCASVCTTLLTLGKHDVQPEGDAAPDELFKSLMEHGFQPDLVHLTALMRNFCVRGDLATAWKVLEIMVQHNIDPDARALSILLNRSKLDRDFESFEKVVDLIQAQGSWSRELLHDCLDTLFRDNEKQDERRRRQRKGTHDAWQPMLELYAKFFDLAPLQKFTLFPLQSLLAPETRPSRHVSRVTELLKAVSPKEGHEPIQPDSITFEATLLKYWTHFANLLRERDPHIMTILEQQLTWLHDIFLRAFSQYRGLLTYSVKFVDHMLRRAREEERQLGRNVLHHPPSVHTWTILLNAFKNHHYPTGSVAVLELMVRNDQTQPNLVSWNALIMAFARTRNVKAAVESMHYLEQAGLVSDEHTVAAFQRFPMAQREEAIRLLERARRGGTHSLAHLPSSTSRRLAPFAPSSVRGSRMQ